MSTAEGHYTSVLMIFVGVHDILRAVQAFWRAVNSVFGDKIQFKTTLKGASMMMNSAIRDLWMPGFCFFLLFATMIAGLIELFTGNFLLTSSSLVAMSLMPVNLCGINGVATSAC